ncbi:MULTISPECIES: virulence factor Mce family protein [Mycobacterium]|uniref:Mammalian cell entry protein n=2 Tax=Mycobacterium ulcerans group TaxID=2993898 RepID=A0A9N7LNQ3_9MYCO|nr:MULTISPECIES: virulence factor Mce family protein [Mycobacterium]EPQ48615.1 MCE-family lipoprotein [Mycobacterium sp. 012931]MBC9865731.1 MCE-family lipoprotein MceE [Mycobacterium pseudoshottsii]RFZ70600.1 mce related protein [Mycobacterium marinum]BAV42677.1 virulence factor Mce family protein [Mycobacterium ulcerans subsp. shinshuense]BBA87414.1 mammalian cell entry protein [Mycobacterium pseudoshottsii JCM 15466]
MMRAGWTTRIRIAAGIAALAVAVSGCSGWRGLNSLPLPGVQGGGPGSFTIQAQMPDVDNIEPNSRVRVGDVNVGTVTKIERQGWHALVTMKLNGNVELPANATATLGQTSLLGSLHIELAPPTDVPPEGNLREGSLIPLSSSKAYPSTEQALAATAMLLNGGGIGDIYDITEALSTAFTGRENDLRSLIEQLDEAIGHLDDQKGDIIAAAESLNNLMAQLAAQRPVLDKALRTIPDALAVLKNERENLADALTQLGRFSALAADSVNQTKDALVQELKDLGPTLESLANAGPALTRALSFLPTYPFPKETLTNWMRGDYANLTLIIDMTLSRIDAGFFTGTRWEGDLTELELQWGRTIGQMPSPYTVGNPLIVPYRWDQGP